METKNEIIKKLQKNYDPKLAEQLITGEPFTASDLAENHLYMAIRSARAGSGVLTLDDIARILTESLAPEELGYICRKLLIKEN